LLISLNVAAISASLSFAFPTSDVLHASTIILITTWLLPLSYLLTTKRESLQQVQPERNED
jgi:hypothetical protein